MANKENQSSDDKPKQTQLMILNLSDDNSNDMEREVDGDDQEGQVGDGNPCEDDDLGDSGADHDGGGGDVGHLAGSKAAAGRREGCEPGSP